MASTALRFTNASLGNSNPNDIYGNLIDNTNQFWNGSSFGAYAGGSYSTYKLAFTHVGAGLFTRAIPAITTSLDPYAMLIRYAAAGIASPATTDEFLGIIEFFWDGSTILWSSNVAKINSVAIIGNGSGTPFNV